MSSITPTIGRVVWYWSAGIVGVLDAKQPFCAQVIYVSPHASEPDQVNLLVIDHSGRVSIETGVTLREHQEGDSHSSVEYRVATWMPYQMAVAASQAQVTQKTKPPKAP